MRLFMICMSIVWLSVASTSDARVSGISGVSDAIWGNSGVMRGDTSRGIVREDLCPSAASIAPCVCTEAVAGRLKLDCSDVSSEQELANVFQQQFPTTTFYEFHMKNNDAINRIEAIFGDVTFERMELLSTVLESVSAGALESSAGTLVYLYINGGFLEEAYFPFQTLPQLQILEELWLDSQQFTSLPPLTSETLKIASFTASKVSSLTPGTFDGLPSITYISLAYSALTTIETGAFILPDAVITLYLHGNQLDTVQPGAFVLPATTGALTLRLDLWDNLLTTVDEAVYGAVFPFLFYIDLEGNPLTCGCDMAWIVMDPENLKKVTAGSTCADGRYVNSLDPGYYQQNC